MAKISNNINHSFSRKVINLVAADKWNGEICSSCQYVTFGLVCTVQYGFREPIHQQTKLLYGLFQNLFKEKENKIVSYPTSQMENCTASSLEFECTNFAWRLHQKESILIKNNTILLNSKNKSIMWFSLKDWNCFLERNREQTSSVTCGTLKSFANNNTTKIPFSESAWQNRKPRSFIFSALNEREYYPRNFVPPRRSFLRDYNTIHWPTHSCPSFDDWRTTQTTTKEIQGTEL